MQSRTLQLNAMRAIRTTCCWLGGKKDSVATSRKRASSSFTGDLGAALSHEHDLRRRRLAPTSFRCPGLRPRRRLVRPLRVKESPVAPSANTEDDRRPMKTATAPPFRGFRRGRYLHRRRSSRTARRHHLHAPIARLGYMDYSVVTPETQFTIFRPKVDKEGNLIDVPKAAE